MVEQDTESPVRMRAIIRTTRGAVEEMRRLLRECGGSGGAIARQHEEELASLRRSCFALYCESDSSGDADRVEKLRAFVKMSHHGQTLALKEKGTEIVDKALTPIYEGCRYTLLDLASRALELRQQFKDVSLRACEGWMDMFYTLLPDGHADNIGCFRKLLDIAKDFGMVMSPIIVVLLCKCVSINLYRMLYSIMYTGASINDSSITHSCLCAM